MTAALQLPEHDDWTVDDLATLPKDARYELINGRLVVTSPIGPHQDLSRKIANALEENCPPGIVPFMELSLKIDRRNQPRPDVVAVNLDHVNTSPVPIEDAVLAVEVLSKDSTFRDMVDKYRLYAAAGVPSYWVLDPLHQPMTLTEFVLNPETKLYDEAVYTAEVFETERPWPVRLDLPALAKRWQSLLGNVESE